MTIIPNQFFGIGDIIFCNTLVRRIANGNPIIWPVLGHFVEGLNRAYADDQLKFVDYKTVPINFESREHVEMSVPGIGMCTILPLRWADVILNRPYDHCMAAKYDLYGQKWESWRECATWNRNEKNEEEIYSFQTHREYRLVNKIFGSESKHKVHIPDSLEIGNLHMGTMFNYSLFDWSKVIENASEIHVVNSSIIYLLEMLDLKAPEVHLYQRSIPGQTFSNIEYLLSKHKYIFHG